MPLLIMFFQGVPTHSIDYKDVIYLSFPIPGPTSDKKLAARIKRLASEIFDENFDLIQSFSADSITRKEWMKQVLAMVANPIYKEGVASIMLKAVGRFDGKHDLAAKLVAAKLCSQAPSDIMLTQALISWDPISLGFFKESRLIYEEGDFVEVSSWYSKSEFR
jgi:hypothetical protein